MKYGTTMWWVPMAVAIGCNAKLIADSSNPGDRKTDAGQSMITGNGGASEPSNDVHIDASVETGGAGGTSSGGTGGGTPSGGAGGEEKSNGGAMTVIDAPDANADSGVPGPRCKGVPPTCGSDGMSDCCASSVVPGGTFMRDGELTYYDTSKVIDPGIPVFDGGSGVWVEATVSDFGLDTYEVTVGRFRKFVEDTNGHELPAGAGKNPNSADDPGWFWSYNDVVFPELDDATKLKHDLNCNGQGTWTATADKNENLPMNCITWLEAYAFCIWDGGRLPTEAEWHYAAEAANEHRYYPWSVPATSRAIDPSHAIYTPSAFVAAVGSTAPQGNGKWGQADLAGNVAEWLADGVDNEYDPGYYPTTCDNCEIHSRFGQQIGGGSFESSATGVRAELRDDSTATYRSPDIGVRCARNPR